MNQKIGLGQAVILLFICRVFNVLNYIPIFANKVDIVSTLFGIVFATILNFILIIPAIILLKKYDGQNLLDIAFHKNKFIGYLIAFIYGSYILVNLVSTIFGFNYFITTAVYPNASNITIILTFCVVCFICAQYGLEGIARTSTIVFILFIVSVAFIGITALKNINLLNLTPTLSNQTKQVIDSVMVVTSKNTEIYLILLLAPKIKGSITKCFVWYIIATGAINFLLNFLIISVLGEFAYSQTLPYFTLASICETKILQRLDAVHMVIWVFISFIKVTTYIILITKCFNNILPRKIQKYSILGLFAFTVPFTIMLTYSPEYVRKFDTSTGLNTIILLVIIPLLLIPQKRNKGGSAYEEAIDSVANNPI